MRNIFTIFQREFASYFNSPVGYIYIIVFVIINAMLFVTTFFSELQADMRQMFSMLPWILSVLMPLVSMRLWAEERKENTIEMLLTFPMAPHELVLGKYLASLSFFAITLVSTFTIPVMIGYLGSPDWGVIISSYLGALLLGAFFLSVGIFLSGLVRDQIVAAVLSLACCFSLVLLGTDFIATILDDWFAGFGNVIKQLLGVTPHYDSFIRGIISVVDVLYFFAWISIFLFLNGLYLEGRSRQNSGYIFSASVVLSFTIAIVTNYLVSDLSLGRFDCTQYKIYTISPSSVKILSNLKAPVTVNLYITASEQMPSRFKTLEQEIKDKINELQIASNGMLKTKVIHLEVKNLLREQYSLQKKADDKDGKKKDTEKSLEETLLNKGIRPFPAQTYKGDQYSTQLVYSAIGISYKTKPEKIISEVHPYNLYDLEYQIISRIYYLACEKKPTIVLIASKEEIDPNMANIYMQLGQPIPPPYDPYRPLEAILGKEEFEVKRIGLDQDSPLPSEYDAIMVIHPKQLNERQKWELAQALRAGKTVLLAIQNYTFDYKVDFQTGGFAVQKISENPQVNDWLEKYGIKVHDEILMDSLNTSSISRTPIALPMHILVSGTNMDQNFSVTNGLNQVIYTWGAALKLDEEKLKKSNLQSTVLMKSSPKAWLIAKPGKPEDPEDEANFLNNTDISSKGRSFEQYPLMVFVEGQFPDVYVDAKIPRPKWPEKQSRNPRQPKNESEEPPFQLVEPKPGKLLLVGGSQLFQYNLEQRGREQTIRIDYPENHNLVMKSIDFLMSGDAFANIQSRGNVSRRIELPESRGTWKVIHYLAVPILVFLIGVIRSFLRRVRREDYTLSMQSKNVA